MTAPKRKSVADRDATGWQLAMALILLLACANGARGIWSTSISGDELNTLSNIGAFEAQPLRLDMVVAGVRQRSADHTPLYFVSAAAWSRFAGISQVAMRYLSLLYGTLAIATLFRLAAEIAGRRTALLACLLMSAATLPVWYSAFMRMYSLLLLLATAHCWIYWRLITRERQSKATWLAFYATAVALLYTQPLTVAYFVGLAAHHVFFVKPVRRFWQVISIWTLSGATMLPWLGQLLAGSEMQQPRNYPLTLVELIESVGLFLANGQMLLWLPLLMAFGFCYRRGRHGLVLKLLLIAAAIFATLAAVHAWTGFLDFTRMRYFLLLFPFVMIAFAIALDCLPMPRLTLNLFVVAWIVSGYQFSQPDALQKYRVMPGNDYRYPPLQRYVLGLSGAVNADDFLLGFTQSDYINWEHPNLAGTFVDYYLRLSLGIDGSFLHETERKYRLKNDVNAILRARPHLLLAQDPSVAQPNVAPALHFIEEQFVPCPPLVDEPTLRIGRYRHPVLPCDHAPAAAVDYDNGFRLLDRAVQYDSEIASVQALLWWEIPAEAMLDDFNISLQVFNSSGDKAAQVDRHLDGNVTPWGIVELAMDDLPAGDYQLKLILYNRHDGAKVSGVDEATGASVTLLPIHEFTVVRS